ncbi:MAG: hypothetical protein IKV85_11225 [Ruminococcus sp.]|jgi:hypothetical protein|nr:hypothetical protein [Ruminococcus sp.]
MKYILQMPSYTYAQKAVRLLVSFGYRCELKRREGECGYDLYTEKNSDIPKLLNKYKIPYNLYEEGAS